jgi:hypothetical protein
MTNKEIRNAVTQQIINMLENDILNENGGESFVGWLEDGEVFRLNGMTEYEVAVAMSLAKSINDEVTTMVYNLEHFGE